MKTMTRVLAVAALMAVAIFAQRPFGVMTSNAGPDPEIVAQNHVARLTRLLSLTAGQATQATTIFTSSLSGLTPLQAELRTNWQSMQDAVKNNSTGTIDSLAASIGNLTGRIAALQNKADAAFYAILTPEQQTMLDQSGGMGMGGRGGMGMGRGPGRGPGPGMGPGPGGRRGPGGPPNAPVQP
jgi:Spy/CpxP family protein refolding chaperone